MEINVSNTGVKNVIDLINHTNTTTFTEEDISLGSPEGWTDPEEISGSDTRVTVTAIEGSGFEGTVDVTYTRIDLDVLRDGAAVIYEMGESPTLETILTGVASLLGVNEEDVELSIVDVPAVEEDVVIQLTAVAGSYLYSGQCDVTLSRQQDPLGGEIASTDLGGFSYPA